MYLTRCPLRMPAKMAGMAKDTSTRMNYFTRLAHYKEGLVGCAPVSSEERHTNYAKMADEAFDEEEGKA